MLFIVFLVKLTNHKDQKEIKTNNVSKEKTDIYVTSKSSISPVPKIITEINSDNITVDGQDGKVLYPLGDKVRLFLRDNGKLLPITINDLSLGQRVTIENIIPGQSATIIVEK